MSKIIETMKPHASCQYVFDIHKIMKISAATLVQAKKKSQTPATHSDFELQSIHIHIPLQNCHGFDTYGLATY